MLEFFKPHLTNPSATEEHGVWHWELVFRSVEEMSETTLMRVMVASGLDKNLFAKWIVKHPQSSLFI
jgi:hypothetical protein